MRRLTNRIRWFGAMIAIIWRGLRNPDLNYREHEYALYRAGQRYGVHWHHFGATMRTEFERRYATEGPDPKGDG